MLNWIDQKVPVRFIAFFTVVALWVFSALQLAVGQASLLWVLILTHKLLGQSMTGWALQKQPLNPHRAIWHVISVLKMFVSTLLQQVLSAQWLLNRFPALMNLKRCGMNVAHLNGMSQILFLQQKLLLLS